MITIKEIAKLANASSSTVSRVLNDSGYVSEETRKRVLKVIEETGYIPSEQAKSLRTKKTSVIGVIIPRLSTDTTSRLVNAINDELAKKGYQIILTNTNLHAEKEVEHIKLLRSRQVDGLILIATNVNDVLLKEIRNSPTPIVVIGQEIPGVSVIVNRDFEAAKQMTQLIIENGHNKIGFIGVHETDKAVGVDRKAGYLAALNGAGIPVNEQWIVDANFDYQTGYRAMKQMMEQSTIKPTAVLTVTDTIAIGAMQYMHEHHLAIPDDIAITGMGNSKVSQYIVPSLTTIDFLNEQTGKEAARLILNIIDGKEKRPKKIQMKYRIIKRDSV
ncbi:LacI family DNA-binding transcriptional regulator [Virgibacillus soli]|uniref:LacI family DNA-binding transcriptional regulator n=1 Tax=Paracerasibacillus soli TaxID=480284 RepID=A0ABU5CTP0_9BACI|nr:LacI family DNA-binding transcriptional regulator [Virgibacillus soli]MDY0409625.1 LacI family DNA-binding transcriptional regulator [Virgibacillus soli]